LSLRIIEYEEQHEELVRAFNARMADAGSSWKFYDRARPTWLEPKEDEALHRKFFIAIEDGQTVRGAYCLKSQDFLLSGRSLNAASIQGPVSEGLVDPRYGAIALHLIRDMQAREPVLFAWGASERLLGVLSRLKWKSYATPLCLRVVNASRFLKENRFVASVPRLHRVSRLLRAVRLESVGFSIIQAAAKITAGGPSPIARVIVEPRFGPWADDVWEAVKGAYRFVAVRDSSTMNRLLPETGWPEAEILRIERDGATIGWAAVRCAELRDDPRFGDLRVGSVVDALAVPGSEGSILRAATSYLERQKAEVIVANFSSGVWVDGFRRCGFLVSQSRRTLIASPALAAQIGEDAESADMHLTPLDGDGPLGL